MRDKTLAILRNIILEAESATNAWYQIMLLQFQEGFVVEKRSGRKGHLGDRRAWFFRDQAQAEKTVNRILREKTKPGRKRVYRLLPTPDLSRS